VVDTPARPSGAAMNAVYDWLRGLPPAALAALYAEADPTTPAGALLRHQLVVTVERVATGRWAGPPQEDQPCAPR